MELTLESVASGCFQMATARGLSLPIRRNVLQARFWPTGKSDPSLDTRAFMGNNPENEAQPKVDECFVRKISHLNGPLGGPFIESAHDLHEPTSQQDDRAPQ